MEDKKSNKASTTREGSGASIELASRNNNPGNIRVEGSDTEFVKFGSMQEGWDALLRQIDLYKTGKSKNTEGTETLMELMAIYAPKKDNNDPVSYANNLAKRLGINTDTLIKDINTNKLALAISEVESPQTYKSIIADENVETGVPMSKDRIPYFKGTGKLEVIGSEKLDNGKYKTSFMTPEGKEDVITTNKPVTAKKVFGESYLSEKGTDVSYEMITTPDGTTYPKKVADSKIAKTKLNDLMKKAGTKEGLSANEYKMAQVAYSVRQSEIDQEIKNKTPGEGWKKDSLERDEAGVPKRNVRALEHQKGILSNQFAEKIVLSEYKKRRDADVVAHNEAIKQSREAASNGEITPEQLKRFEGEYNDWSKLDDAESKKIADVEKTFKGRKGYLGMAEKNPSWETYTDFEGEKHTVVGTAMNKSVDSLMRFVDNYNPVLSEEEEKLDSVEYKISPAGKTKAGSSAVKIGGTSPGVSGEKIDPTGLLAEEAKTNPEIAKYLDEDYLLKQNKLDQETIDFIKSQKHFNAEMPEEEYDYNNLIGNISDVGRGIVGLVGASEDVPEYKRGEMFQESMDDARRMKDMGLSAQETGFMKQNAERAFGFGVANVRGLSGGSGAAALGALGQQTAQLQNQYNTIGTVDHQVRRENRQAFAQAANQDELVNRQIFEDKLGQVSANKREGAALARDAYTNMNERAQFNQQYGKGSQYQQYMNEQILSNRQARYDKKAADERRNQESISRLQGNQEERTADIKKWKAGQ